MSTNLVSTTPAGTTWSSTPTAGQGADLDHASAPSPPADLFPAADQFPLGRAYGCFATDIAEAASVVRPFGLRLAVRPTSIRFDPAELGYDHDRQIGLIRSGGAMVPLAKHTDGTTSTQTNADGQSGPDSDTDHRED
jgi:putative ATP-grasp target RiPP